MTTEELRASVISFFNTKMPFNQLLGFKVEHVEGDKVEIILQWDDKLMGNPVHKILHGGVTAAVLDTVGSLAVLIFGVEHLQTEADITQYYQQLANGGTLDMRVDYLRPGKGDKFIASAEVIRKGNKVAVCKMNLHNQSGMHIATGTATYII